VTAGNAPAAGTEQRQRLAAERVEDGGPLEESSAGVEGFHFTPMI